MSRKYNYYEIVYNVLSNYLDAREWLSVAGLGAYCLAPGVSRVNAASLVESVTDTENAVSASIGGEPELQHGFDTILKEMQGQIPLGSLSLRLREEVTRRLAKEFLKRGLPIKRRE
jgi:hypothetical protein